MSECIKIFMLKFSFIKLECDVKIHKYIFNISKALYTKIKYILLPSLKFICF